VSDVLIRIKRAVLAGQYAFSEKARSELEADCLTELDVAESILNAVAIYNGSIPGACFVPRRANTSTSFRLRTWTESRSIRRASSSARRPVMFTTFLSRQSDRLID
jgi:hypothetical protein